MTTASLFREPIHADHLMRAVLPRLAHARRRLRLWSAECASGEEAWSLAMLVAEARLAPEVRVTILATHSDPCALARAREAVYRDDELPALDAERRRRHCVRGVGPRRGYWRIIAPLRDRVELAELAPSEPWPERGSFDVVCCHGALAALDPPTAAQRTLRFAGALAPGGVLLGADAKLIERAA